MKLSIRKTILAALLVGMTLTSIGCRSGEKAKADRDDAFEAEFATGMDREPTAQTLYTMGRMLVARNRDDQAYFVFDRCLQRYPDYVPAYNDMAELLIRNDRLDLAREHLTRGLELSPGHPVLVNNLGMCHLLTGEYENALAFFKQAHEIAPHEARYSSNMATAHGLLGQYDEALSIYRSMMHPADAHHNVGVLAEARNDSGRAAIEFAAEQELRKR